MTGRLVACRPTPDDGFRIEHDTMGEVRVPADALWRAQTQRAVENFPISGRGMERAQIRALGLVKARRGAGERATSACWATDRRRRDRGGRGRGRRGRARRPVPDRRVPDRLGHQLEHERQRGDRHPGHRAPRASTVHPNDHVNASQSSATTCSRPRSTSPRPRPWSPTWSPRWSTSPRRCAAAPTTGPRSSRPGRTHLMDAVPITLGQEAGGWATQVEYGAARLRDVLPRLAQLPIGGTAVGTGLNAPDGFAAGVVERAARGHRARRADRGARPHRGPGRPGRAGGGLGRAAHRRGVAVQDRQRPPLAGLRAAHRAWPSWHLPDLQPGSSIMPGKVNPVICEATMMVAAQVIGNDATRRVRRHAGQPRAQRDDAGDGPQRAGVAPGCWRRCARLLADKVVDGARGRRGAHPGVRRVVAVDRDAAQPLPRLRGGGLRREAVAEGAQDHPRGGAGARPRRATGS